MHLRTSSEIPNLHTVVSAKQQKDTQHKLEFLWGAAWYPRGPSRVAVSTKGGALRGTRWVHSTALQFPWITECVMLGCCVANLFFFLRLTFFKA